MDEGQWVYWSCSADQLICTWEKRHPNTRVSICTFYTTIGNVLWKNHLLQWKKHVSSFCLMFHVAAMYRMLRFRSLVSSCKSLKLYTQVLILVQTYRHKFTGNLDIQVFLSMIKRVQTAHFSPVILPPKSIQMWQLYVSKIIMQFASLTALYVTCIMDFCFLHSEVCIWEFILWASMSHFLKHPSTTLLASFPSFLNVRFWLLVVCKNWVEGLVHLARELCDCLPR